MYVVIATLKKMAEKAFLVVERGWKALDVTLVDFKVILHWKAKN